MNENDRAIRPTLPDTFGKERRVPECWFGTPADFSGKPRGGESAASPLTLPLVVELGFNIPAEGLAAGDNQAATRFTILKEVQPKAHMFRHANNTARQSQHDLTLPPKDFPAKTSGMAFVTVFRRSFLSRLGGCTPLEGRYCTNRFEQEATRRLMEAVKK